MRFDIVRLVTALLFILCHQVNADSLDSLPPQWQQQLNKIAQIDISTLKPDEQKAIKDTRAEVNALLQSADADTKQLASAYGKLGNFYLTHELYTSADACYNNAIQLAPEHFPWMYYSAYLAQKNGNMQAALSRFKQASKLDPGYLPAQYRLAQVYLDLNLLDEAYTLFNALLSNAEFEAAAYNGLGQALLMKQDYSNAAEHFTRALELAPEATSIHYPLALSLRATGKNDLAKQHLQQYGKHEIVINDPLVEALEALKDPASRHFSDAMTAVLRKILDKATTEFESGLEYEPDNTSARTSYARVLYLNGNKEKSRVQLEQVITLDPDNTLALFLLALIDDESNNIQEAEKLYRRVLTLNPTHEGAHFFLGNYYLRNKDYKSALKHYETVTLQDEKNVAGQIFKLVAMMGDGASDKELLAVTQQITARAPNMFSIKRIQVLILALSQETGVRDSKLSLTLAEQMYDSAQYPANLELVALATASTGDYVLAIEQMRKALTSEEQYKNSWNIKRMNNSLLLLKNGQLPELQWHEEITHMLPPPTNALATFRDYPDANPI